MKPTDEHCEIPLTLGKLALVDREDHERFRHYRWKAWRNPTTGAWYAIRCTTIRGKSITVYMHREILGLQKGDPRQADHIESGRTLDNRRSNLRVATRSENCRNRGRTKLNTTGFKGVHRSYGGRYTAMITVQRKQIRLGTCDTPEEAYALYVEAAKRYHGDFANVG